MKRALKDKIIEFQKKYRPLERIKKTENCAENISDLRRRFVACFGQDVKKDSSHNCYEEANHKQLFAYLCIGELKNKPYITQLCKFTGYHHSTMNYNINTFINRYSVGDKMAVKMLEKWDNSNC